MSSNSTCNSRTKCDNKGANWAFVPLGHIFLYDKVRYSAGNVHNAGYVGRHETYTMQGTSVDMKRTLRVDTIKRIRNESASP
jgi:hypothetical protein